MQSEQPTAASETVTLGPLCKIIRAGLNRNYSTSRTSSFRITFSLTFFLLYSLHCYVFTSIDDWPGCAFAQKHIFESRIDEENCRHGCRKRQHR